MLAKDFYTAGRAVFTVKNPSGERYTYRISHKEANGSYRESWFVSLLTGPDNTRDYTYMGMLDAVTGAVNLTRKSKFNDLSQAVRVVRWALNKVWTATALPEGYEIHHEGRCGRCGRALTVPESIESGIGPECAKIMGKEKPMVSMVDSMVVVEV